MPNAIPDEDALRAEARALEEDEKDRREVLEVAAMMETLRTQERES